MARRLGNGVSSGKTGGAGKSAAASVSLHRSGAVAVSRALAAVAGRFAVREPVARVAGNRSGIAETLDNGENDQNDKDTERNTAHSLHGYFHPSKAM